MSCRRQNRESSADTFRRPSRTEESKIQSCQRRWKRRGRLLEAMWSLKEKRSRLRVQACSRTFRWTKRSSEVSFRTCRKQKQSKLLWRIWWRQWRQRLETHPWQLQLRLKIATRKWKSRKSPKIVGLRRTRTWLGKACTAPASRTPSRQRRLIASRRKLAYSEQFRSTLSRFSHQLSLQRFEQ